MLPEDWTLRQQSMETPRQFEKAVQPHAGSTNRNSRRGNERWASSPQRSVSPHGGSNSKDWKSSSSVGGGSGNSVGAGSSPRSSPASETKGCAGAGAGGTRRLLGGEMAADAGVAKSSPRRTRASRVLKTSRDLAQTLRRVYEVGKTSLLLTSFSTGPTFRVQTNLLLRVKSVGSFLHYWSTAVSYSRRNRVSYADFFVLCTVSSLCTRCIPCGASQSAQFPTPLLHHKMVYVRVRLGFSRHFYIPPQLNSTHPWGGLLSTVPPMVFWTSRGRSRFLRFSPLSGKNEQSFA